MNLDCDPKCTCGITLSEAAKESFRAKYVSENIIVDYRETKI